MVLALSEEAVREDAYDNSSQAYRVDHIQQMRNDIALMDQAIDKYHALGHKLLEHGSQAAYERLMVGKAGLEDVKRDLCTAVEEESKGIILPEDEPTLIMRLPLKRTV